jgi:hypothetical protein
MSTNPLNDISRVYLEQVAVDEAQKPFPFKKVEKQMAKARAGSVYGKETKNEPSPNVSDAEKTATTRFSKMFHAQQKAKRAKQEADKARRSPTFYKDTHPASAPKMAKAQREEFEMDESAVPGKPAEKLGAVTLIPKAEQEAARERALAKAKAMREKRGIKTEAVKGVDPEMRKAASAERKAGDKRLSPSTGKGYADQQKQSIAYMDKLTKKNKNVVGLVTKEALDSVGHEDADVDNDGKKNTNSDKYLLKRRKAIGKAISTQEEKEVKRWWDDDGDGKGYEKGEVSGKFKRKKVKEAKVYDPMEDPDFDPHEAEKNRGVSGKNNPKGGKPVKMKEGYSNWREDLSEVVEYISKDKGDEKITEKKVKNKIKINPNMGEAVENLGGTLLEMIEIDEMNYILESVYDELLEEGYEEDDIEEAIEYSLTEAKVTFGHDTAPEKKKSGLMTAAKARLSSLKKSAKQAVATGARKVAKGALKVARKLEGGDKTPSAAHTGTRKASTYRGVGQGKKIEVASSGSYTAPTKKKAEKPADPWEGTASTPPKAKAKAKAKTTKVSGGTAKAPAKRKRKSKLDDLLASVRSEEVQIDEKVLTAAETKEKERIVKSMKDKAADFEKRYPGRGKEVMYATATKMAKKMAEQAMEMQPKVQKPEQNDQQQKKIAQQKDRQKQQEVQILQRKLQALRSAPRGVDSDITAGYEPVGEVVSELNRFEKEKGINTKTNRPTQTGGNKDDKAFTSVKRTMRKMEGTPAGQRKKVPGKKPPVAGQYGAPASPAQKVAKLRAAAQRAQDNMSSRFD